MRGNGFRRWRPIVGVVALGVFAFGWSLTGAAKEEHSKVPTDQDATSEVVVETASAGEADSSDAGGLADVGPLLAYDVGSHRGILVRGVPVDQPVMYAEMYAEAFGGLRQEECLCDLDCADGDPCTEDLCGVDDICTHETAGAVDRPCDDGNPDGLFCTTGRCDTNGVCLANQGDAVDVCGEGYVVCGLVPCCDEDADICDECDVNGDCDDGEYCNGPEQCINNECEFGDDPCPDRACDEDGDACTGDAFTGRCCEDEGETCNVTSWANCQGAGQLWAIGGSCPCPKFSAGWAPPGGFWDHGRVTDQPCERYTILGDDYTLANGSYITLERFAYVGGMECTSGAEPTVVFEFWDSVTEPPTLVTDMAVGFTCPDDEGPHFWYVEPLNPFVIPPTGYVTYRSSTSTVGETLMWWATEAVDIGGNNPDLLWYNNNRGAGLISIPNILAFELEGAKVLPPIGACCSADGLQCVETVEWLCVDTEEPPMGWNFVPGGTCPDSCDVGACCIIGGDDVGDCIENVLSQTACEAMPGGGEWQGYGTDCDPNCCLQPFTGGDDCDLAIVHEIVVPPVGSKELVTVTISGDTSAATQGLCFGEDYYGWFEAFKLVESPGGPDAECAEVWIDKCCTSETWSPSYYVIYDGCNEAASECGRSIIADDYAYQQYCGGDDGNFYLHFDALPGGTYHYDMLHPPDAPVGGGPYQMHITVGGCSDNACCTVSGQCTVGGGTAQCPDDGIGCLPCVDDTDCPDGETCWRLCTTSEGQPGDPPQACTFSFQCALAPVLCPTCRCLMGECWAPCSDAADCPTGGDTCDDYGACSVLNPIECEAFEGLAPENTATCFQTCDLGACCTGPGVCVDNSGAGMTLSECRALGSDEWYPSARCEDDPCAVCPFEDPEHCQTRTEVAGYIVAIDHSLPLLSRWADDFRPSTSGPLERLCWVTCFRIDATGVQCHEDPPADDWEVRFYADSEGLPGMEIGPAGGEPLVVDVDNPNSIPGTVCSWRTAPVTTPPTVQAGECYWIEIMGNGEGYCDTCCNFYWGTAVDGNGYALNDGNEEWGPEDVIIQINGDPDVDMQFCVDVGMGPEGCGEIAGCCCTATECVDGNQNVCYATGECSGLQGVLCDPNEIPTSCPAGETCIPSVFYPAETCEEPNPCTGPPENDWCENAFDVTAAGQPCEGGAPCTFLTTNILASQDVAGVTSGCVTDGSMPRCNEGGALTTFDLGADVWYEYHTGPLECGVMTASMCALGGYDGGIAVYDGCECYPPDDPMACGDDTCGMGGDVACVKVPGIKNNKCYLIRVGGWAGAFGSSEVDVTMEIEDCGIANRPDPVGFAPDMWTNPPGDPSCMEDSDCRPTTLAITPYCIPALDEQGQPVYPGTCYAPTNRYLSIARNPDQSSATGRRITLSTGAAGPWWVGAPSYNAPEDTYFASVQDTPVFAGMGPGTWVDGDWPDEIHVKGCEIAPGTHTYLVQAVQSGGEGDEANYSPPLDLRVQVRWADVVSSCFNNECLPPSGTFTEPSIDDVLAEVNAFQGIRNAPLWWMDIDPVYADGEPEGLWTLIGDVLQTVNAFTGQSYPGWGPNDCDGGP